MMIRYRRICDGFVMDMKTGLIEEEHNVQYVPYANPVVSADPVSLSAAFFTAGGTGATFLALGGQSFFVGLASVLSFVGKTILSNLLTGSGSATTGQSRDEGVKTRVSPDTANRLPVVYGDQRMKGTIFMSELSTGNDSGTWITMVAVAEGEIDGFTQVSWGDHVLTLDGDINTELCNVTNARGPGDNDEDVDTWNDGRLKVRGYPEGGRCEEMEAFNDANNAWVNDGKHVNRRCPFAYFVMILEYDQNKGVTSLGNINFEVNGRRVRELQPDGTLSQEKVYTSNPADCVIDYLTDDVSGARLPDFRLDTKSFVKLKDFCDEDADYTDLNESIQQAKRYTCNGVVNTNSYLDTNIEQMMLCCQSSITYVLGQFGIIINREKPSTFDFNDDNIVGNVQVGDSGFDTLNNEVIMHFNSKKNNWQEDQVDAVSPDSVRNDNEPELSVEVPLAFTNNSIEAQRLAHIDLNQWRQNIIVTFDTFISALEVQAGDVVTVTHSVSGFDKKEFRIMQVEETSSGPNNPLGLKVTALEYDSTVYTINAPHEVDAALNTNLPNPTDSITISNIQGVSDNTRHTSTGLSETRERVSWNSSQDRYVSEYEIDYKLTTETFWTTTFSSNTSVLISGLEAGTVYDVRVRAITDLGRKSDYATSTFTTGGLPILLPPTALTISEENVIISEATGVSTRVTATWSKPNVTYPVRYVLEYTQTSGEGLVLVTGSISTDETFANILPFPHGIFDFQVKAIDINEVSSIFDTATDISIVGLTDTPSDVTGFNISASSGQALLSWTQSPDIDVRSGGTVKIKYHSSITSSANWAGAQDLISNVSGRATSAAVPILTGTYLIKFVDSGGRESANAAVVTNTFCFS